MKKEKELQEERRLFEEKYEKEILHQNAIIENSEIVYKDQIQQISELQREISDQSARHILQEQNRKNLMKRLGEVEEQLVSLKKVFQEKEEALTNEIKILKQRSNNEEEAKTKMYSDNKIMIDDIKKQYEYDIKHYKQLVEKKQRNQKKNASEEKPVCPMKTSKLKQNDDLFRKKVIGYSDSKNFEDIFHEEDTDTVNLQEIITHLKDENEHLRVKSQFQKETRDKLEQRIFFLEKQIKETGKTMTKNRRHEKETYKIKCHEQNTIKKVYINLKNDSRQGNQKKRKSLCSSRSRINEKLMKYHT